MDRPPHLPPQTCDLRAHRTFKSIGWLLFLVFVSGLVSVALTLSTLVWLAPSFNPDQMVLNSQKIINNDNGVDLSVLNNVKKRLWNIYDTRDKVNSQFYADSAPKYQAVMFSSDGWAVAYVPDYRRGDEKYWEGIDYQGTVYEIDKVSIDPISKLTYIKFVGDSFPFISFADWENISNNSPALEVSFADYRQHIIKKDLSGIISSYKIWLPQLFYLVDEDFAVGNILVQDNGQMIGIINKDGWVIYSWLIESQYASILQTGAPNYMGVDWSGYMVNGHVSYGELKKKVSGFYVSKSITKATASTIGVGDVITKIQNQPVNTIDLGRQILLSPNDFSVTVYRDGQEFDIMITKSKVLN